MAAANATTRISLQAQVYHKVILPLIKNQASKVTAANVHKVREGMNNLIDAVMTIGSSEMPADEVLVNGMKAEVVRPKGAKETEHHMLYLHGGAFILMNPMFYRSMATHLANSLQATVLTIDYRLAPEFPFPAAVEDAQAAYKWLLHERKIPPSKLAIAGDSAGGNLTVATLLANQAAGIEPPAAAVCLSPWLDLLHTGATMDTPKELMLPASKAQLAADLYCNGRDASDPLISPLYASNAQLAALPPTLVHVGSDEMLLDDSLRFGARSKGAGGAVQVKVYPGMQHVFQFVGPLFNMPEGLQSLKEIAAFVKQHWGRSAGTDSDSDGETDWRL